MGISFLGVTLAVPIYACYKIHVSYVYDFMQHF